MMSSIDCYGISGILGCYGIGGIHPGLCGMMLCHRRDSYLTATHMRDTLLDSLGLWHGRDTRMI